MKKLITFSVAFILAPMAFSQGSSCDDATLTSTSNVISETLTGSEQHYFYILENADDSIKITIQSDTDCGVVVEMADFASAQNGVCVNVGTTNQIKSNPTSSCMGDSTVNVGIDANQYYYFRVYRNFAPAPENYTLTIEQVQSTASISEAQKETIEVTPNPGQGIFNLKGSHGDWKVYNSMNQEILTGNQSEIDLRAFPAAIYIVQTENAAPIRIVKL